MTTASDIQRRATVIESELDARTTRMAGKMLGEFDQDDALSVTDAAWHKIIRENWTDPAWRVSVAQRIGPKVLYRAALEAFGRRLDGSPSIDSHPDSLAAEPAPTALKPPGGLPDTHAAPSPDLPNVFPFQGPAQPAPQPIPVMPMMAPPQIPQ